MAYKQLTPDKRYEIKAYMQAGISLSRISGFIDGEIYMNSTVGIENLKSRRDISQVRGR